MNEKFSTTPPPKAESIKTSASANFDLPGHRELAKNREAFEENQGLILTSLCTDLGLDRQKMSALIAHESKYSIKLNSGVSQGLMQINTHPIEDIQSRFTRFAPILAKVDHTIFPRETPPALTALILLAKKNPNHTNPAGLESIIRSLSSVRGNPIVNLVIGCTYMRFLEDRADDQIRNQKTSRIQSSISQIIQSPETLKRISRKLSDIGVRSTPESVAQSLRETLQDPEKLKEYISLRNYNGNTSRELASTPAVTHRDIYASLISTGAQAPKPVQLAVVQSDTQKPELLALELAQKIENDLSFV